MRSLNPVPKARVSQAAIDGQVEIDHGADSVPTRTRSSPPSGSKRRFGSQPAAVTVPQYPGQHELLEEFNFASDIPDEAG